MADFTKAFLITLGHEGGYSNDVNDNGGETYKGISRKFNPDWQGWKIIDNLKRDSAFPKILDSDSALQSFTKDLYKKNYWDINKLDLISNQEIANEIFDTGVNQGVKVAAKYLQDSLNLLNRNGKNYSDLIVDGDIGSVTIGVVNSHLNQLAVLKTMNGLQFMKYVEICKSNPSQEIYFLGWLNRVK